MVEALIIAAKGRNGQVSSFFTTIRCPLDSGDSGMKSATSRHVVQTADGRWAVMAPNAQEAVKHSTERQAITAAKRIVHSKGGGEVRVFSQDGRIRGRVVVPPDDEPSAAQNKFDEHTFTASVWQEGEWFVAQALEIDIASQGQTVESALANLREALELRFEPPTPSLSPEVHRIRVKGGAA